MTEKEWLLNRGLTEKTIQEAGITWANRILRIPWRVEGKEVGWQLRWIDEKKFKFSDGFDPSTPYLPTGEYPPGYTLWVTEGAMDALILHQLGYPAIAIPSATSYSAVAKLPGRELVLALDNDAPGEKACEDIASLNIPHKLSRVKYVGKDPNECVLQNHGEFPHEIVPYIVGGLKWMKEFSLDGNVSHAGLVEFGGVLPQWDLGDFIVLYGEKSTGKTSWLLSLLSKFGTNTPTLFNEYEMRPENLIAWYLQVGGNQNDRILLSTDFMDFSAKKLFARITSAVKSLGVKLVVIDTLHYHASASENVVNLITSLSQRLKLLAMEHGIAIVVIMHETDGKIRDCHLIGSADHILHLKRLKNSILIDGIHRNHPEGTYSFAFPLEEKHDSAAV